MTAQCFATSFILTRWWVLLHKRMPGLHLPLRTRQCRMHCTTGQSNANHEAP